MNLCLTCGKKESFRWYAKGTICNACYSKQRKLINGPGPEREPCLDCGTTDPGDRIKGCCDNCYHKELYKNNREKYIENSYKWQRENPERHKEVRRKISIRKRAKLSKEQKQEKDRKDWAKRSAKMSPEEIEIRRQRSNEFHKTHKDDPAVKESRHNAKTKRRASESNAIWTLTHDQWLKIIDLYDHQCAYCGKKLEKFTQDHVIPISKGGNHTIENVVPACLPCNQKKGNRNPPQGWVPKTIPENF